MIELRAAPPELRMARLTVAAEPNSFVVYERYAVGVLNVATRARCVESAELTPFSAFMAEHALHRGVRANQRESRPVMFCDRFARFPGFLVVALCACSAKLALVHVFVTASTAAR